MTKTKIELITGTLFSDNKMVKKKTTKTEVIKLI